MLILERRSGGSGGADVAEAFLPQRLARTGLHGAFRFTNLPAGTYQLQGHERWLGGDPLELLIDLGLEGAGGTARVAGNVRFNGKPLPDASVRASGMGSRGQATTDAEGYYETTPFLVGGSVGVSVWATIDSQKRELYSGSITPVPGTVHRLDVDGNSVAIQVRVKSQEDGQPLQGAEVSLHVNGSPASQARGRTDESGELTMDAIGSGNCEIKVQAPDRIRTTRALSLDGGDAGDTIEIVLARAVPCAGRVDLSGTGLGDGQRVFMQVGGEGGIAKGVWLHPDEMDESGCVPFEIDGLGLGEYGASLHVDDEWYRPVAFELPVGGNSELLLVHPGPE